MVENSGVNTTFIYLNDGKLRKKMLAKDKRKGINVNSRKKEVNFKVNQACTDLATSGLAHQTI